MKLKIFYSWQSDLPNKTNRNPIENAITKAIGSIQKDQIDLELNLDRDTQDIAGTPDIVQSIFKKIRESQIYIGDISFINQGASGFRKTPNPNVLIELGYAAHCLSWENIILVFNKAYGNLDELPFDLRIRRPIVYQLSEDFLDKSSLQIQIKSNIEAVIKEMKAISTIYYGRGTILGKPSKEQAIHLIKELKQSIQLKPCQNEVRLKTAEEEMFSLKQYVMFATPSRLGEAAAGLSNIDGGFELIRSDVSLDDGNELTYNLYRSTNGLHGTITFHIRFYDL